MLKYVGDDIEVLGPAVSSTWLMPSVASLSDGGWLMTWVNLTGRTSQQRYAADGTKVGDLLDIEGQGFGITGLKDGGWMA